MNTYIIVYIIHDKTYLLLVSDFFSLLLEIIIKDPEGDSLVGNFFLGEFFPIKFF